MESQNKTCGSRGTSQGILEVSSSYWKVGRSKGGPCCRTCREACIAGAAKETVTLWAAVCGFWSRRYQGLSLPCGADSLCRLSPGPRTEPPYCHLWILSCPWLMGEATPMLVFQVLQNYLIGMKLFVKLTREDC